MSTEGREQDLLDWVDGTLAPERRRAVDAHLRGCGECRAAARDLQIVGAGLEALGARRQRSRRVIRRWMAGSVAAAVIVAGATYLLTMSAGRAPNGVAELAQVEAALDDRSVGALLRHARSSGHLPVRLAAITQPIEEPAVLSPADLVRLFESEGELIPQLWIVAEVARSGDAAAAREIRRMVAERESVPAELRAAVADYLGPGQRQPS